MLLAISHRVRGLASMYITYVNGEGHTKASSVHDRAWMMSVSKQVNMRTELSAGTNASGPNFGSSQRVKVRFVCEAHYHLELYDPFSSGNHPMLRWGTVLGRSNTMPGMTNTGVT